MLTNNSDRFKIGFVSKSKSIVKMYYGLNTDVAVVDTAFVSDVLTVDVASFEVLSVDAVFYEVDAVASAVVAVEVASAVVAVEVASAVVVVEVASAVVVRTGVGTDTTLSIGGAPLKVTALLNEIGCKPHPPLGK